MEIKLYNTMSREKEPFIPYQAPYVGLYVCGPTVYGDTHLGHARPAVTFDLLYRFLTACAYKVRYVRNITDVGHLENDADDGEDKLCKRARLEEVEPMELAQHYTRMYHRNMDKLNVLPPSIEPHASGHIIEQIELVKRILDAGYAYQSNGSVYFDVDKYNETYHYGKLSGRILEDMISNTRELDGQSDKRKPYDFALWKKAAPEHIMRWPSPWSDGFPGWHLECTAMSTKYLGEKIDIHGGGMDLMFPHHECEIAQGTVASDGHESVKYWMHNNMITIGGQKMGKSLGNFITLDELFSGRHVRLDQAYSPMTIRFFILQAHYRSTLDFSNEALQAAEKGLERLLKAIRLLTSGKIKAGKTASVDATQLKAHCMEALGDDLNSPIAIAHLFEWVKIIHLLQEGKETITEEGLQTLVQDLQLIVFDILGLRDETTGDNRQTMDGLVKMVLDMRQQAKASKDWTTSDRIRDELLKLGIEVQDRKDGYDWEFNG